MPIGLYDAVVPSQLQILEAMATWIDKAEAWCAEMGLPPKELIEGRLAPDMWVFRDQVKSAVSHSLGAIGHVRQGTFADDPSPAPDTFAGLRASVTGAIAGLKAADPAEFESFIGREVAFNLGERRFEFTAENFLLSFSQPNFYFHATTAYDILRHKGLEIGKRDFMGRRRTKDFA